MTSDTQTQVPSRREQLIVLLIWLAVGAMMVWNARASLAQWTFPDPDDAMRLVQVRDWLAGQSWFDVTQYRLNPPAGGPMHWSRLVDLPIAAVVLVARPFLGQHGAETAALIVVPLVTLGIAMLLVHRIAFRLLRGPGALLAVIATPASLGAMKQMRILRVDHHGWQIVMALIALLAFLDAGRPRRSGLIAGAAIALWLNISIEGLPFAAAIGVWFALEWLANASAGERLKAYIGSLTIASASLFALTHAPSTWLGHPHDVLNDAHLVAFGTAFLCCLVAVRPVIADRRMRLAILALAGIIAAGAAFAVDPHWLQGPFASLDPIVRDLWYNGVDEGQPVWKLVPGVAAAGLAQPVVGLVGALVAIWKCPAEQRYGWMAFAYLLGALSLASIFVIREATTASVLSLPGTAFLCELALHRARKVSLMPARALATTGALCIMAPAYAVPASVAPDDPRLINALQSSDACVTRAQLEKLNTLPTSNLAAPLDITPAILASTPHRAIASGYHRNVGGIRDVILLFSGSQEQAREIVARRHIDYVVICPNAPESIRWATHGPDGLAAMLNKGRAPDWLDPVRIADLKGLRVWRVRKDLVTTPKNAANQV